MALPAFLVEERRKSSLRFFSRQLRTPRRQYPFRCVSASSSFTSRILLLSEAETSYSMRIPIPPTMDSNSLGGGVEWSISEIDQAAQLFENAAIEGNAIFHGELAQVRP